MAKFLFDCSNLPLKVITDKAELRGEHAIKVFPSGSNVILDKDWAVSNQ